MHNRTVSKREANNVTDCSKELPRHGLTVRNSLFSVRMKLIAPTFFSLHILFSRDYYCYYFYFKIVYAPRIALFLARWYEARRRSVCAPAHYSYDSFLQSIESTKEMNQCIKCSSLLIFVPLFSPLLAHLLLSSY